MSTEISRLTQNPNLPAYLQEEDRLGTDELKHFVSPPRFKVIQSLSRSDLREQFNVGDLLAMPMGVLVSPIELNDKGKPTDVGRPFTFVPVFFFAEWITWNPREAQDKPMIAARSLDPRSEIAVKARDPNLRKEASGVRHQEHMNFVVLIDDEENPMHMTPAIMGFARGEHKAGTNFASLARMAKAPLMSRRYTGQVRKRENAQGEWYGITVTNPPDGIEPWVSKDLFEMLKAQHLEFKQAHEEQRVRVEYDEEEQPDDGGSSRETAF